MEGDLIRTIRDNMDYIGHFHTADARSERYGWNTGNLLSARDAGYCRERLHRLRRAGVRTEGWSDCSDAGGVWCVKGIYQWIRIVAFSNTIRNMRNTIVRRGALSSIVHLSYDIFEVIPSISYKESCQIKLDVLLISYYFEYSQRNSHWGYYDNNKIIQQRTGHHP